MRILGEINLDNWFTMSIIVALQSQKHGLNLTLDN